MPSIDILQSRIGDALATMIQNVASPTLDLIFKASPPRRVNFHKIEEDLIEGDGPYALLVPLKPDKGPTKYRNSKRKTYRFTLRFVATDYQGIEDPEMLVEQGMDQVFADPNEFFASIDDQEENLIAKDGLLDVDVSLIGPFDNDRTEVEVAISVTVNHKLPLNNG